MHTLIVIDYANLQVCEVAASLHPHGIQDWGSHLVGHQQGTFDDFSKRFIVLENQSPDPSIPRHLPLNSNKQLIAHVGTNLCDLEMVVVGGCGLVWDKVKAVKR